MLFRAQNAGVLPATENGIVGGVKLPPGRLGTSDPVESGGKPGSASQPVLWITKDPVDVLSLWKPLAARFAEHGLWPLVLESLGGDDERPWLCGEFDPSSSTPLDGHDALTVLADQWEQVIPVEEEDEDAFAALAPFEREFPGLAAPTVGAVDDKVFDRVLAGEHRRLGLVAVTRPADVLATIGWLGPVNHYGDMGLFSSVLRSWEDRFGAYVVAVGFDTLTLAVQRPPRKLDAATAIAAEHFAMCSDNIYQGSGSIEEYASLLVDNSQWSFWWD